MDFKHIDKKYKPIPFWAWNDRLVPEESRRQVALMDEASVGGFFMHARGGLQTPYMGEEWFKNVKVSCGEAKARGMHPWAYDENGWPSGFGDGRVCGLGEEYQQKALHVERATDENKDLPRTVLIKDGYRYFYSVNEFYVDVLDRKVIARFIDEIYRTYAAAAGDLFEGFFTDEPQIMRSTGFPWSFPLPETFREKYGYDLIGRLDELFFETGDYRQTRVDFWKLVTELFSENYFHQIREYCDGNGYGFTGHLLLEETLLSQLASSGASMPHYEYFTIPGMDWLGRPIFDCFTPKALGSAAAQAGQKQVLSETFALCGHNVSHGDLKRIFEWQQVRGVNLLCTHLEGYTLRGIRKRDYPPAMYYQQPWWQDMKTFFDATSRTGMLLAEGEIRPQALLLHPQTSAWILYNGLETGDPKATREAIGRYDKALLRDMKTLERKHILYHLGDEILLERHGRVEGKTFVVGKMRYTDLILPERIAFLPGTERLIEEFRKNGGRIVTAEQIPANPVCEENALTYTMRAFPDFRFHFFVNSTDETVEAKIPLRAKVLDAVSGELLPFSGSHTFAPTESLLLIEDGKAEPAPAPAPKKRLPLSGEWKVKAASFNSVTLDRCDYSFDGEEQGRDVYVLDILPRLNLLRRPVRLSETFRFTADELPEGDLFLALENPERFEVSCNGKAVPKKDCGFFRDSAFRLLDLRGLVAAGENEITLVSTVCQSEKTFAHIDKCWAFETMKNSLSYDEEIEQIYLVGNFGARFGKDDTIEEIDRNAYRSLHIPHICRLPERVEIEKLDFSGFPTFAGELTLEREYDLSDTDREVLLFGEGINSIHLSVNGKEAAHRMFAPYTADLSGVLRPGRNTLTLRLIGNLRNMQGPFHLKEGESYSVSPASFFRESNVFAHPEGATEKNHDLLPYFDDRYCFVHYRVKG